MSALFTTSTQNLRATLSSPPAYDSGYVLLTAWVKWDSGSTAAQSTAFEIRAGATPASDDSRLALVFGDSSGPIAQWFGGWDGGSSQSLGAAANDAWRLIAAVIEPNSSAVLAHVSGYNNSSTPGSAVDTYDAAAVTDLSLVTIGNRAFSPNSGTVWMGRVAECAIWTPADVTEASAIVAECLTTKPDAVTTATPIWYAPLEADASVVIGSALTNNGTVTFSDADHPSLSGGSTAPTLTSPTGTATGTTTATIGATTDTATGTLYGYVSTSATPPSAANLKAGTGAVWSGSVAVGSTGAKTLSATGLTAATGYYAHLIHTDGSANDSNIVTSAQFTTNALTKKLKLLVHPDAQGDTGVAGVVFAAPAGSDITGAKLGEFTGKTFEASLESGKAVLKVPVTDFGGGALTTSDTPVALVRNATDTTGIISGTVIEE